MGNNPDERKSQNEFKELILRSRTIIQRGYETMNPTENHTRNTQLALSKMNRQNLDGRRRPTLPAQGPDSDDNEDEEIDEDEAFNSDDERKYGSFFINNHESDMEDEARDCSEASEEHSDDDDDDGDGDCGKVSESDDGDSQDGDGGKYMLDVLDKLSGKSDGQTDEDGSNNNRKLAAHMKESQFSSSVLKSTGLTIEELMDGIKDTKGFGALAKAMKHVATGKVADPALPRVVQDRLERKVHYDAQAKKISAWTHVVQENRQADTLDFRPQEKLRVTKDMMVDSFQPSTDFEKELDAALKEAGQKDEEAILEAEEKALADDLGSNAITLEEFKRRRGQLAKVRALMFYHEQKRHHINKIKSKKYRRIRKRQRERLKDAEAEENPDVAAELKEKEEVDRIRERMTLAHKNTSKWAKRVLKRGKNVDIDTRRALSAQLKRGDDLRQKILGKNDDDDDDSDEDLVTTARRVLEDTEEKRASNHEDAVEGKGLFKLAFMQRGLEKERQRAKEEARELLRELEEGESRSSSDDEHEIEAKSSSGLYTKRLRAATKDQMKGLLKEGEMVATGLTFGNSTSLTVSGAIHVGHEPGEKNKASASTVSEHNSSVVGAKTEAETEDVVGRSSSREREKDSSGTQEHQNLDRNPWMLDEDGEKQNATPKKKRQRLMVDVSRAAELLDKSDAAEVLNHGSDTKGEINSHGRPPFPTKSLVRNELDHDDASTTNNKQLTSLSQDELVRRAFAVDEDHAEQAFKEEKDKVMDKEDDGPIRKKSAPGGSDVAGWGSWTGMGAPPALPTKRRKKLPARFQPPVSKLESRARQDTGRANLIIRERRMKHLANTHMLQEIPHPYRSREEYELAMTGGLGTEWNVHSSFREQTRPSIQTRAGKIIQPIASTAKKRGLSRPAAKF